MIRIKNNTPARLPSEYQEVEYLEDSGSQYINTGVPNSSAIKVVTEEQFNGSVDALSGIDYTVVSYYRFKWGTNSDGYLYYGYGTNNYASTTRPDTTKWYRFTMGYGNQKIEDVETGTVIKSGTATMSQYHSTYGIHLFAVMNTYYNRIDNVTGGNKIRSCKIYDSDTLIRDFVPCYRKSDNEPGMYDLVNNVFYTNAGSGTFLMGNEVGKRDINIKPMIGSTPLLRRYVQGKLVYGEAPRKGRFVAVGASGNSYYSLDGETWASMSGLNGSANYYGMAYGNGRFVCVGSTIGVSYYSLDGTNWVAMSGLSSSATYRGVAYGNGRFITFDSGGYSYYSTNGTSWTSSSRISGGFILRGITYGNDRFVAVGDSGKSYYSTDGINWTAMSGLNSSYAYYSVAYGNGKFVTVESSGYAYYSTNGTSWTKANRLGASYACRGIAYGNGIFVAIGSNGKSYYSTDGITWSDATTFATGTFYGITYANGIFVVVGNSGYSYYSTDGVNWVAMTGLASAVYYGVCYGEI